MSTTRACSQPSCEARRCRALACPRRRRWRCRQAAAPRQGAPRRRTTARAGPRRRRRRATIPAPAGCDRHELSRETSATLLEIDPIIGHAAIPMRLVRVALASVNTTVGACRSNVDRAIVAARAAAADGATRGRLSRAARRRLSARGPRAVAGLRRRAARPSSRRFARETAALGCASARGPRRRPRGAPLQRRRARPRRAASGASSPRRSCPLYNVFYEARTLARGAPGLHDVVDGVPFGDLVFDLDFGTARARGLRGRLVARRADATALATRGPSSCVNLSASPFRVGIAETRREMIATRAADCQVTVALREPRRRQRRPRLRRRRLRRAERAHAPRGARASARASQAVTRRPRPHAAAAHREHDLARGPGGVRGAVAADGTRVRVDAPTAFTSATEPLAFPAPAQQELLPARRRSRARVARATPSARSCSTRSRSAWATTSRRTACFKTIGVALSGGRDSLLVLAIARRWIDMRWRDLPRGRAQRQGARDPARVLHADALLVGRDARRRRADGARPRRALRGRVDRRRVRARARRGREDAPAGRVADAARAPERAGARARRAHVDVGERRRRASSSRRAT